MGHSLLPKELLELQLGQIDLLLAMYASDDAATIEDSSLHLLDSLRTWCESDDEAPPQISQPSISLLLSLALDEDDGIPPGLSLLLELSVPLVHPGLTPAETLTEPPKVKIRPRQPEWMSKAEVARLTDGIPDEDLLTAIEHVKEAASRHLVESRQPDTAATQTDVQISIDRTWFYFPSISTRSKRDDIVNYAPAYGLTGFLLAGKPGILCLEGGSQAIDDYMKFIKTESWGDIPPQHKKVSERYRESGGDVQRVFRDMQEITDVVGERRGERANRNDMRALEAWLNEHGVGEAFAKVLI